MITLDIRNKSAMLMTHPRHYVLFAMGFFCSLASQAQTMYESPHVKDGKTVQLSIPEGYFEVTGTDGFTAYATRKGLDFIEDNVKELPVGLLSVMHLPADEKTYSAFVLDFENRVINGGKGIEVIAETERMTINGKDFMFGGVRSNSEWITPTILYFGIVQQGDYFMIVSYYVTEGTTDVLDYLIFKETLTTLTEVETGKEEPEIRYVSPLPPPPPVSPPSPNRDSFVEKILLDHYKNDLFETQLSPLDITPSLGEHWMVPMEGNSHLLSEFVYKTDAGSIKIFSGGIASNYSSIEELEKPIKRVMNSDQIKLKLDSYVEAEYLFYTVYSVENGGTISSVYFATVNNETVFFVVDEGSNPDSSFKTEVSNFMSTMWMGK